MIGTSVSHYKILEKLGEGGMGVVYKAQDSKLDRLVALKFLPDSMSTSSSDGSRFVQEAKAAAALNHPNICTIYGIDEADGKHFIVMEFVDGQTLQEKKTSISLKQAIDIGIQIADGLAVAHEKGIVHRVIKPENIMIRKDGIVQIMDFGLAKLRGASRLTKEGSTVGTAGYMSPEQVQGQETDHRSDIFSLGVILYELFTGQLPFKGVHETAVNYEIVNVDPDPMSVVKPELDPELDRIVLECLNKEPEERYQAVKDISKELKRFKRESSRSHVSRISAARSAFVPASSGGRTSLLEGQQKNLALRVLKTKALWMSLTILFFGTTVVMYVLHNSQSMSSNDEMVKAFISLPDKESLSRFNGGGHLAISPDGRKIAYVAVDSSGRSGLWIRPLNSLAATLLSGTQGAQFPFWSPDSRTIGFFAGGKVKKVEAAGGPPFTICDVGAPRGGSWNQHGIIVFPADQLTGISKVSDAGGVPTPITKLDSTRNEQTHRWPYFLPDGEHFLYLARTTASGSGSALDAICVASIDGKENKRLIQGGSNISFANGQLLYMRESSLMAHPFDPRELELKGDPFPIVESVEFNARFSVATFSVSQTGVLVYDGQGSSPTPELVLVDVPSRKVTSLGNPEIFASARLSNDGQKIAMDLYEVLARNADIWILELRRNVLTKFTFDSGVDAFPLWSPDGGRLVFSSNRKGHNNLYEKVSSGAASEQLLLESDREKIATDWSRDGKFILFQSNGDPKTRGDVWYLPTTGERKPIPLLQSEFNEVSARFSPDGKWITYQSNQSGRAEIYVRPFPSAGSIYQVSTNGGTVPRWQSNGKQIFYLSDSKIMSADVSGTGSTFVIGKVKEYLDPSSVGGNVIRDISGDGQKVLLEMARAKSGSTPLVLVMNWTDALKKK